MLELEEAVDRILALAPPPQGEQVPVDQAHGRILLEPVRSPLDLPPFDNSAMDGYAVRSENTTGATSSAPVRLRIMGSVAAGETFNGVIETGCCARIFTGSPLPAGSDCVVMQEDTQKDPAKPGEVFVLEPARPWENVRLRGEDVRAGATLAESGKRIGAGLVSLLAAVGKTEVKAARRPIVGLLATGSELRRPGELLHPGQIYESNCAGLTALIHGAGAQCETFPFVADTLEATSTALSQAFERCDIVVTVGGASVGDFDLIKPAMTQLGAKLEFWKVAIKPGRPFVFGKLRDKLLCGLPGNPVSALVTFLLLVRPALMAAQGAADTSLRLVKGILSESIANAGSRRHFMRVRLGPDGAVSVAGPQASHMLGGFAAANGLLDVPPGITLAAGAQVSVRLWEL